MRRSRRRREAISPRERIVVGAMTGAAAIGGAMAGAHPTANRVSDVVLTAALAAVVTLACSISRTWTWIVLAGTAAVCSTGSLQAVGFALELGVIVLGATRRDIPARRIVGAVVGAVAAQLLLRLGAGPFMGSTALVAGAAMACVLVSAWRVAHSGTHTIVRRTAYVVGGVALLAALAAAFSLLAARDATNQAVTHVRAGLDAARAGDTAGAANALAAAADSFSTAHDDAGSWWTRPAELLPVIGQQVASVDRLTAAGEVASAAAAKATTDADVNGMRLQNGHIDVTKIAAAERPLTEVIDALGKVTSAVQASRSDWLVRPLATRIDAVANEVARASNDAQTALDAVRVAPGLLGSSGPRRYFVVFANPAEARDLGGFAGGYGELVIDAGKLRLVHTGRASELNVGAPHPLTAPNALPIRYRSFELERFWQNISSAPDFPTVAEAVRQLWPQTQQGAADGPLDGVLYVDPYALAAVLRLTGEVTVPGFDTALSADTVVAFLTRDQYTQLDVQDERHDLLSDTAKIVFDKLTSSDLPGPRQIADAFGPPAHAGRLLLHSYHPEEQALFARLGIDGALAAAPDADFLAVTASNRGENKIDALLTRTTEDSVRVDPRTGRVDATVRVTLRNDARATGLPDYVITDHTGRVPPGTNTMVLSVMSPWGLDESRSDPALLDGQPVPVGPNTEYGLHTYSVALDIPPGATQIVELHLTGQLRDPSRYRLVTVPRANVGTEHIKITVEAADGSSVRSAEGLVIHSNRAEADDDLLARKAYGVRFAGS